MNIDEFKIDKAALTRLGKAAVQSFDEIYRPGESKKDARKKYNDKIRSDAKANGMKAADIAKIPRRESPYIHSTSTYRQYINEGLKFVDWLEKTQHKVRRIKFAYRKGYAREYIQYRIDEGDSPSTIGKRVAALAKLFRVSAAEIHDDRPKRITAHFTRSRSYNSTRYENDVKSYGIIAEICRITGVRECELERIKPECFFDKSDGVIGLHLDGRRENTKGGKTRNVVIIEANQTRLREILADCAPNKYICPKAPHHLDVHGIRAMYAADYYNSIARDIKDIPETERVQLKTPKIDNRRPGKERTSAPGIYCRADGAKFDRRALLEVSKSLGHNRVDVVVHSYLH